MAPFVRSLGGTVVLHDWRLVKFALGAWPSLERRGVAGLARAWREGGIAGARARWSGSLSASVLNRSVVRLADAFLVHDPALGSRVLRDRNALTPVGVLPPWTDAETDWSAIADRCIECLEVFPHPRSLKRSLLRSIAEAAEARAASDPPG